MINLGEHRGELKAEDRKGHIQEMVQEYTGKDSEFMDICRIKIAQKESAEEMLRCKDGE